MHRLDRLAKDFERDMDRALDRSRANGTDREDRINDQIHQFRDAVGDLKSRVGNGRDLNRSADEARTSALGRLSNWIAWLAGLMVVRVTVVSDPAGTAIHQQRLWFWLLRWLWP